jgi:hypothetical protein
VETDKKSTTRIGVTLLTVNKLVNWKLRDSTVASSPKKIKKDSMRWAPSKKK